MSCRNFPNLQEMRLKDRKLILGKNCLRRHKEPQGLGLETVVWPKMMPVKLRVVPHSEQL